MKKSTTRSTTRSTTGGMANTMTRPLSVAGALLLTVTLCACAGGNTGADQGNGADGLSGMPEINADIDADINLDALNQSVDAINDLNIDTNVSLGGSAGSAGDSGDAAGSSAGDSVDAQSSGTAEAPQGGNADMKKYSYCDVAVDGTNITLVPNGGLNGSTVFHGDKDLNGFLDYIDSDVLEKGRTINREFFYDLLSTMNVDKDLTPDFEQIEKNMIMALAVADNFYNMDVRVKECYLDGNNAAEYRYQVKAIGKDDIWTINYRDGTFFMNDGATEYHSSMFEDKYLALWMMVIEDYYGIQ